MTEHRPDHRSERTILLDIDRKVNHLMATVEDVLTTLTTLTTDLEALAAIASAEFAKLEEEAAAAGNVTPAQLDAVKGAIEAIDTKVRGVVVPTA